jgi:hypothetical protein
MVKVIVCYKDMSGFYRAEMCLIDWVEKILVL